MRWRRNAAIATVRSGPTATGVKVPSAVRGPMGNAPAAIVNARIKATVNAPGAVHVSVAENEDQVGHSLAGRAAPVVSCGCSR